MRFNISAPTLTEPTFETLEKYAIKKFSKIKKFLKNKDKTDHEVRISVKKEGKLFDLTAEIFIPEHIIINEKDRDLRRAVDMAVDTLKDKLRKEKDKKARFNRIRSSLSSLSNKFSR